MTTQIILEWIGAHPGLAGVAIFLVAFSESLVLVGLLVPGAVLMVGIGAVIATGAISLPLAIFAAIAGAVSGDSVSFWLGRFLEDRAHHHWPFRNHPHLVASGEQFFRRHGGLSVFLGRFFGPLRPIVPFVAGLMDMPPRRFLLFNIASALIWAPAYLLPGLMIGETAQNAFERWGEPVLWAGVALLVGAVIWWAIWQQEDAE